MMLGLGAFALLAALWNTDRAGWIQKWPAQRIVPQEASSDPETPRRETIRAEGRLVAYPGAEVVLGAEISGRILTMPVAEMGKVGRGDLIAKLNEEEWVAACDEASARIAEAESDIEFYEQELARRERLHSLQAGTQLEIDSHRRNLRAATARRNAAMALRRRCEATLAKTRIVSPIEGVVLFRHVQPGEIVEPGTRLATIADLRRLRVEAEVDEFDIGLIELGARAEISAPAFSGRVWSGTVEEIPDTVVGRKLRPEDPAQLTDTRVLLVKIALDRPTPLKLGQRVEVFITTSMSRTKPAEKPPDPKPGMPVEAPIAGRR
jgi:RND family efflux transporter MFP subunit